MGVGEMPPYISSKEDVIHKDIEYSFDDISPPTSLSKEDDFNNSHLQ